MHPSTAPRARAALRQDGEPARAELHPATAQVLRFFGFEHLPPKLQEISEPFADLAARVAVELEGPEATVCLRKLLEAKDCAVRAALP
jgi:hypothetical protein